MKHSQKSQVASGGRTNDAQGLGWCNDGSNFSGTSMVQKVIKTKRSYQKKLAKILLNKFRPSLRKHSVPQKWLRSLCVCISKRKCMFAAQIKLIYFSC